MRTWRPWPTVPCGVYQSMGQQPPLNTDVHMHTHTHTHTLHSTNKNEEMYESQCRCEYAVCQHRTQPAMFLGEPMWTVPLA
jgi:hypothetical protein